MPRSLNPKRRQSTYSITSMPVESEGQCKKCHKYRILGDGYCARCWDHTRDDRGRGKANNWRIV